MKKGLRLICLLLAALMVLSACAETKPSETKPQASGGEADYSEHMVITVSTPYFLETGVDYMDDLAKEILKEFNAEIKPIPVSLAELDKQNRIWIASGDMPDITWAGFNYSDYANFANQGLVRPLPEDYAERYPNLAKAIAASGYDKPLLERHDGVLYGNPKPIFVNKFIDPFGDHASIYYRKDWAEKLGLPVKTEYTIDELMAMAKAFMEQDPNGNGAGKTIGYAAEPGAMIPTFLQPYDSGYGSVYKKDGKYVFGPFQEGCLQGMKDLRKYYDEGIVYRDFYAIKARGEVEAMFNAGLTGIMRNGGAFGNVNRLFKAFGDATGMDPLDCIEMANIVGPDGKIHCVEMSNIQSINYYSPEMSEEKFERILAIVDYVATPEVQNLINLGFEGKDYKKEGDKVVLTRAKNENGGFLPMGEVYPSYNVWMQLAIAWDDFTARDPSIDPRILEKNTNLWKERVNDGNLLMTDYDLKFYSSKPYDKLVTITSNLNNDFTNLVIKSDDLEAGFNDYIKANSPLVNEALDDVNNFYKN